MRVGRDLHELSMIKMLSTGNGCLGSSGEISLHCRSKNNVITWLMKAFLVCSAVRVVGNMVT